MGTLIPLRIFSGVLACSEYGVTGIGGIAGCIIWMEEV